MSIAVIDSGVHADHPHVGGVAGGVAIDAAGRVSGDFVDRIGHGTAVMAAIKEKAPAADCYAVRIFDTRLAASCCPDITITGINRKSASRIRSLRNAQPSRTGIARSRTITAGRSPRRR